MLTIALLTLLLASPAAPDVVCSSVYQTCGGGAGGAGVGSDNTWTGQQTFIDNKFLIADDADLTKKLSFQLSALTPGTTRTYTMPNASGGVPLVNTNNDWTATNYFYLSSGMGSADQAFFFGSGGISGTNNYIWTSSVQTPDTTLLSTGTTGRSWVMVAAPNNGDFAHPTQANPTLFIHSVNQSTTEHLGLTHNGTGAVISSGAGPIYMNPAGGTSLSPAFVYGNGYGALAIGTNGTSLATILIHANGLVMDRAATVFGWASNQANTFGGGPDATLTSEAPAVFQLGVDNAQVAQTIKSNDGTGGPDLFGSDLILAGGRATGTATGGNLVLQTAPSTASGSTSQPLESRLVIVAKQRTLVSAATTTFAIQTLGNDTGGGGTIHYCVYAADATTAGIECGNVDYAGVDVTAGAGGEVCPTPTKVGTPLQALSGSTLTVAFAATTGTDLCNLRVTATTSIATPVELWIKATYVNSGRTITPQ